MNDLSELERKTLKAALLRFAGEPFTTEALEHAFPGRITGFAAELALERLRERGIVVTRRKSWGELVHMLEPGLFDDWQRYFIPSLADARLDEREAAPSCEPRAGLAKLILFFAAEAANRGLPLTRQGLFRKADAARLMGRFAIEAKALERWSLETVYGDKLDKPLAVIFDAALRLGLVRAGADAVAVNGEKIRAWLAQPLREIRRQTLSLWWNVHTPSDPWLQHAAAAIRSMPPGQWFSVRRIADALLAGGAFATGRSEDEAHCAIEEWWLRPMEAFGLIELGEGPDGLAARTPAETEEEGGWYVQPDFEWIVPPDVPFRARWELERFAVFAGGDAVDRYRVTRESWERALQAGSDGDQLLAAVKAYAVSGVPAHIEAALKEWNESFGAMMLEEATLLRCRTAEDAAFIANSPELAARVIERIGERVFVVKGEEAAALAEALKRQGFSVAGRERPAASAPREDGAAADGGTDSFGIIRSRAGVPPYPVDPNPRGAQPYRERIAKAPPAWLRSLRKYHHSTVREMMETAIDAHTSVRLVVEGSEVELVPKRLMATGTGWSVEGYINGEPAILPASACGEAQLVVPRLDGSQDLLPSP